MGHTYGMADDAGTTVATADRVGRKSWTVQAGGVSYTFRRPSIWRHEEELLSEGRRMGSVKRNSMWRSDTVADLPGLPVPVQVFVLAVVLTVWDRLRPRPADCHRQNTVTLPRAGRSPRRPADGPRAVPHT